MDRYNVWYLDDIVGQEFSKLVLSKSVDSNNLILIYGPDGTGKTSLARAYSKLVDENSSYVEINASMLDDNNMESLVCLNDKNAVVNIEYLQDASYNIQAKLLSYIDKDRDTRYIICTNDITKVISSIKNRSLLVQTSYISDKILLDYIKEVLVPYYRVDISDEDIDMMIFRSNGNLRYIHEYLYKYKTLGKDLYNNVVYSCRESLIKFIIASFIKDKDKAEDEISNILMFPQQYIKDDYESLILEILRVKSKASKPVDRYMKALYQKFSSSFLELFRIMNDRNIYDLFNSDKEIQTALWYIFIRIGEMNK